MSYSAQDMAEFKTEAMELLEVAEKSLLSLDRDEGDLKSLFDAVFRAFHNLKGAAGMMEMDALKLHMHKLEDIFIEFKESATIPKQHISLFLRGVDAARMLFETSQIEFDYSVEISGVSATPSEATLIPINKNQKAAPSVDAVVGLNEFFAESGEIVERIAAALQQLEKGSDHSAQVDSLYREMHSLKGAAYLFSFQALGDLAHKIESRIEPFRSEGREPGPEFINEMFENLKTLERFIEEARVERLPAVAAPLATTAEKSPAPMRAEDAARADREGEAGQSIRVSVSLLDNLMTLMGEMVLVRNQVLQFSNKSEDLEFNNLSKKLNVVTTEIQGEMMKTRMQPIGNVLSKFSRVVRDLSQELKKEIQLNLVGADTELDKSLLEAIKDPLTHIVRNSCDHGIETPQVRVQNGKPSRGTITIRAYHEDGLVVIEISDDGKGLKREALLNKAIEKGLILPSQVSQMAEKDVFDLIFAPGFSTAAQVTNVSGRGVGMDVVRTNVEKIGGSVELSSREGHGVVTRMKIPLTLAIVPTLIVRCGHGSFAIPQVKLLELVRADQSLEDNKIEYLQGTPVYRLRGNLLPLVSLSQILGVPSENTTNVHNIAVLNSDHGPFGMIVDQIQDTADIVVKPINLLLKSLQVFSGATILGDGSIALILDIVGISKKAALGSEKRQIQERNKKASDEAHLSEAQEYLLVKTAAPTKHALLMGYVHRIEDFESSSVEHSGDQRVIRYGKTILPILSLNTQLGYTVNPTPRQKMAVVVVRKAGDLYGFEIDDILDTLSTDAALDTKLATKVGVYGNLNTPEGLIVVVDPFAIIDHAFPGAAATPMVTSQAVLAATTGTVSEVHSRQILLVEDTSFFRRTVGDVLEKSGAVVTTARDGIEALEILNSGKTRFDLIISDIEMPRMNGFELAKAVRAHSQFMSMPLLAISSRADQNYTSQGLASGFDIYIEKFKPSVLHDAIQNLMTRARKTA